MEIPLSSYWRKGVMRHSKHLVHIFHRDVIKALQVREQIQAAQPVPLGLAWICDDVASDMAAGHGFWGVARAAVQRLFMQSVSP